MDEEIVIALIEYYYRHPLPTVGCSKKGLVRYLTFLSTDLKIVSNISDERNHLGMLRYHSEEQIVLCYEIM